MNRNLWIIRLKQAYDNYQGIYIDDKECKELFELLKTGEVKR